MRETLNRAPSAFAVALVVSAACARTAARADPLPTIVTYELSKSRRDAHAIARDPKGFWVGAIVAQIEARKPRSIVHLKAPATVNVGFVVGRDGKLVSSTIEKSSGDPALDKLAIATLDHAAPFPPMPAALGGDQIAFTVPLRFK